MRELSFDIVVLGQITKDKLVMRGIETEAPGGAVYYCGLALSKLEIKAGVITLINKDDDHYLDAFRNNGVDVFSFETARTTEFTNTYPSKDLDKRISEATAFAGPFTTAHIPAIETKILHIGSLMAGEVPDDLVHYIVERFPKVSLDLQGFLRVPEEKNLVFKDWPAKKDALRNIHTVKADRVEAEVITGEKDMAKAAKIIVSWGPREVVITYADGVLVYADEEIFEVPFVIESLKGRTGRGDTCISAYLASRLKWSPGDSAKFAAAMTSLKLEKEGPFDRSYQDVIHKLASDYHYQGPTA
ncbi:MAG: hypothetical protein IH971_03680 [Candidatus Marinimicrobia bacterium]|nr:hypothetical protein [Candidatus Neomarinimicrobiota bacterium]